MRNIAVARLKHFCETHADSRAPLKAWIKYARETDLRNPADIKKFGKVLILQKNRVVFDIADHRYRLVVKINFKYKIMYIRFIGSYAEYSKIDAQTI